MNFWRATKFQSQDKTSVKEHTQKMAKMTESKTEKKTMWVKKAVEALGGSWQAHPMTVYS